MTGREEKPLNGSKRVRPSGPVAAAAEALASGGIESARAEAELLAAHVLDVPRGQLAVTAGFRPEQLARYDRLVTRRLRRQPMQHLIGSTGFRHLELAVGPGVFVPRPETELLAGWGVTQARALAAGGTARPLVVDLCAGSGAIALSVAHEVPQARVVAVERAAPALAWLRRNAADRVAAGDPPIEMVAADVTDAGLLAEFTGRADVLVCNPPYVPDGVAVPGEVAEHDPADALFAGADGLSVIRPVVRRAGDLLRAGGVVGIEHDDTQGDAVPGILRADGRYADVADHADLAGRPRFVTARRRARR